MAEGRECGCPEWVERCAHFDGNVMRLHRHPHNGLFFVCMESKEDSGLGWKWCGRDVSIDESEVAAHAAFDDAERELLSVAHG